MKIKAWKLHVFTGICFLLAGILGVTDKRYCYGVTFLLLGASYIYISIPSYKENNKK